jgi:hypothetical protein
MNYLPQGTRIRRKENHPLPGLVGTIVGRATQEQPVIGANYIIQPDDPSQVNSEEYPYDFLVSFECEFEVVRQIADEVDAL